ncbi:MAG TPA: hypothetical protein VHN37_11030 [Actinomycetota bacterium]|nr:hypothetical protein [Actinomycetota bacterium]
MDRKRLYVVVGVVIAAVASVVVLLLTGEAEPVRTFEDPGGDAMVGEGPSPPSDTALADIKTAEVREEDGEVVFEAKLGAPVPDEVPQGAFGLRWEVHEEGDSTFLITADLDVGPTASILSERTDFGASTLEDSFPGSLEVAGDTITIRVDPAEVPRFPDEFAWLLKTSLDGDQGDPQSARAEDQAPDSGLGQYPADS